MKNAKKWHNFKFLSKLHFDSFREKIGTGKTVFCRDFCTYAYKNSATPYKFKMGTK